MVSCPAVPAAAAIGIYPFAEVFCFMQEIRLTLKKRAFPSQGRVRINVAHLPDLGIQEGDRVDLVSEATKKTVAATVIADTMVREGQVRASEEDLKSLGLEDGDEVLVQRSPPAGEKLRKMAGDANVALSKGAGELDAKARKAAGEVKAGAAKAAETVKKETKAATGKVGKAAEKTVRDVKKTVKKATRPRDDL